MAGAAFGRRGIATNNQRRGIATDNQSRGIAANNKEVASRHDQGAVPAGLRDGMAARKAAALAAKSLGRLPWCTALFTAWSIYEFTRELRIATDSAGAAAPGHFTLLGAGAASHALVISAGEWWRLFTAPFLHASIGHLSGNLFVLVVAGLILEPVVGSGWFAAIYLAGGLGSEIASIALNPAQVSTVGASGAIMAILGAMFVASFHEGTPRPKLMRRVSAYLLFPALAPTVLQGGTMTDVNAHGGGLLAGIVLSFVMLASWREEAEAPSGATLAGLVGAGLFAITFFAFGVANSNYQRYAAPGYDLIPAGRLPTSSEAIMAQSWALVQAYPRDPRAHFFRGTYLLQRNDAAAAEPEYREALRLADSRSDDFLPGLADRMRAMLALDLVLLHRKDEGEKIAAPVCAEADPDPRAADALKSGALCPGG